MHFLNLHWRNLFVCRYQKKTWIGIKVVRKVLKEIKFLQFIVQSVIHLMDLLDTVEVACLDLNNFFLIIVWTNIGQSTFRKCMVSLAKYNITDWTAGEVILKRGNICIF